MVPAPSYVCQVSNILIRPVVTLLYISGHYNFRTAYRKGGFQSSFISMLLKLALIKCDNNLQIYFTKKWMTILTSFFFLSLIRFLGCQCFNTSTQLNLWWSHFLSGRRNFKIKCGRYSEILYRFFSKENMTCLCSPRSSALRGSFVCLKKVKDK